MPRDTAERLAAAPQRVAAAMAEKSPCSGAEQRSHRSQFLRASFASPFPSRQLPGRHASDALKGTTECNFGFISHTCSDTGETFVPDTQALPGQLNSPVREVVDWGPPEQRFESLRNNGAGRAD